MFGIGIYGSGNIISNNNISSNYYGGVGISGSNNIISNNIICSNKWDGLAYTIFLYLQTIT